MSLINDMLKDLDSNTAAKTDESLPSGLRSPSSKPATKRGWILPALAAVAVIYALVVEMNFLGLMPKKSALPVEISQPIALNKKWLEQGPAVTAAQSVPVAPISEEPLLIEATAASGAAATIGSPAVLAAAEIPAELSTDFPTGIAAEIAAELPQGSPETHTANTAQSFTEIPQEPAVSQTAPAVETLLQAGTNALQESRLTTPAGNNAYQYFKSALLLQPENPQAIAGIAQIQQNYLNWLEHALAANHQEAARRYWFKARNTGVAPEILAEYQQRLDNSDISSVAESTVSAAADSKISATTNSINPPTTAAVSLLPNNFSVATPQFADDASAAARLARDGLVVGEARALRWLEQSSAVEQTAVVLADLYAASAEQSKLAYLHQLLSGRGSAATVYAQAHLAAQQQNFTLATEQLAALEFTGPAEERRLRTLAGFYQKLKDYARAMPLYSRLVNMPSGGANDWLGLAVSADAQQMTSIAQNAYLNLLRLTHPDPRIMGFARQRHQDLSFSSSR
jgi:hypothetical protein